MYRCCEKSLNEAQRWQMEEGEVECEWCGTYIPVDKVAPDEDAYLFEPYFTNEPLPPEVLAAVEQRREAGDFIKIPKLGEGPSPPRSPSPARAAFRQWFIEELGGDPQAPINGSVGLIADVVSFALERRHQAKLYEIAALRVDIDNLLDLIKDESPEKWETIELTSIDIAPPYTAVGYLVGGDHALTVAVTGPEGHPAAEDLAQFFEEAPRVLSTTLTYLREPL